MKVIALLAAFCILQVAVAISVNPEPGATVMQPTHTGDASRGETILTPSGAPPAPGTPCQPTSATPCPANNSTPPAPQLGNVNVSKLVVVPASTLSTSAAAVCCCRQNVQGCVSACPQACPQSVVPEIVEKKVCLCALVNGTCPTTCPITVQPEIQEKCGCCGAASCSCCPGVLTTNTGCGCVGLSVCPCAAKATVKPEYTDESGKVKPAFVKKFDSCNCCGSINCACCN